MVGQIGGSVAGAALGTTLGSLFGSQNRKIGKAGMEAANQLNQVSTNQMNMAQNVAGNNGVAIKVTTDAGTAVNNLSDLVNNSNKDLVNKTDVEVAEAPKTETTPNTSTVDETKVDDENKKKKEA